METSSNVQSANAQSANAQSAGVARWFSWLTRLLLSFTAMAGAEACAATLHSLDKTSRHVTVAGISAYQKHLSPHKGFCCAYRIAHNSELCSAFAKRVVAEKGLSASLPSVRNRLHDCKVAALMLNANKDSRSQKARRGRDGFTSRVCDGADCASLGCDGVHMCSHCSPRFLGSADAACALGDCSGVGCEAAACGGCL